MLKLEAGKRYWRRDGGVSGPLMYLGGHTFCFRDEIMSWMIDGAWCTDGESPGDLVREYTDPQPLQWRRGIPTEEECRECWIITGGDGDSPDSEGCIHAPSDKRYAMWGDCVLWYLPLRIQPVAPPKPKTKTVTQRKYFSKQGEELWTHMDVRGGGWMASTETRTVEVTCE